LSRTSRTTFIEQIILEYIKRYEEEATQIVVDGRCYSCLYREEDCFPCTIFKDLLLQVEEILAGRTAGEN